MGTHIPNLNELPEFEAKSTRTGEVVRSTNLVEFCQKHGLKIDKARKALFGQQQQSYGWRFKWTGAPPEELNAQSDRAKKPVRGMNEAELKEAKKKELREKFQRLSQQLDAIIQQGGDATATATTLKGFETALKVYKADAEASGIDWADIQDARTPEQKALDAVMMLRRDAQSILSINEATLLAIEHAMDTADSMGESEIREMEVKQLGSASDPKARAEEMRKIRSLLRRVKDLRDRAMNPIPKCESDILTTLQKRRARQATHLLRYQAYVGRSGIGRQDHEQVFVYGRIHAKMAVDLWEAENRGMRYRGEMLLEGDEFEHEGRRKRFPGIPYSGALLMYPPRHGKTAMLAHWVALRMALNPRSQGAYLHARAEEANKFIRYVASLFDKNEQAGQRHLSLFPAELERFDNNSGAIRLKVANRTKNPNLIAGAINMAALGNDLDYLVGDDLVPQSDRDEPTERERRRDRFNGTWLTRLQGKHPFFVCSGYPWHHDDVIWDMRKQAIRARDTRGREGKMILVSSRAVGGPNSSPPYKPIWPEMYPAKWLRARARTINDMSIWSANYMLNPITDDLRIVRKVALYNPAPQDDPTQHERFMAGAQFHLSLDPAFTNQAKSDEAGIVLVAIGEVDELAPDESGQSLRRTYNTRVRVIFAREIKATQKELSDRAAEIARSRRIDLCHVESPAGAHATIEFLSSLHGIQQVIQHTHLGKNKEQRLRLVASMLEAGASDIRPVVEFPGVVGDNGKLVIDPECQKIHDYVVNFKVTSGHHSLDALTQVLRYLAPMTGIGEGAVTEEVRRKVGVRSERSQALRDMLAKSEESEYELDDMVLCAQGKGV